MTTNDKTLSRIAALGLPPHKLVMNQATHLSGYMLHFQRGDRLKIWITGGRG